jgi:hypothetical protein
VSSHREEAEGVADVYRLKLYVHDYLVKNGFTAAAGQFKAEAQLGDESVPIHVREGALTE